MIFILVVIDPGHGGQDPGATGYGLLEKNLNLFLAKALQQSLKNYQVDVRLTREDDSNPSLSVRAAYANNLKADLFISLHTNAGGGTGFESYVHSSASASTIALAKIIHSQAAAYFANVGLPDRGLKDANFAVLRETTMPSVLLETLFVDNPKDVAFLENQTFLNGAASAIAAGVAKALHLQPVQQWNPEEEINRLKELGIINGEHNPSDWLSWGEFATVLNRFLEKYINPQNL